MPASASHAPNSLPFQDLSEASQALKTKALSPVELTEACLQRIQRLNPLLNAFITVTAESALEEAKRAEAEISRGEWRGPLHGIPLAVKDLVETTGVRTTAASAVLEEYLPREDAEVIRRLRMAGAVLLGKLNLHEFAYGGSGVIGHFGPARNPWNPAHVTGGSSSGSAAAVAAGMCYGAIGTDTAGSIRLPAACCGIAGLKPTYGLVSTRGIIPLSWSLDHAGPMARTVADVALMLQAIAHYDPGDFRSVKFEPVDYTSAMGTDRSGLRLGLARDFFDDLDPEIRQVVQAAVDFLAGDALRGLVGGVQEVDLAIDADTTLVRSEAYAYHQRYLPERERSYHPETLRRILSGAGVTASQYIAAYQDMLRRRHEVKRFFEGVDLIVTPTTPSLPPWFAELEAAPGELRGRELRLLRNTRPFNVYGLPALSVPCGFSSTGMPIGLQIAGAPGAEAMVLTLAHAYQKETGWHKKLPATSF